MKQLVQLPTTSIIKRFNTDGVFKLPDPYATSKKAFIPHLLALFATIPLVYNDNWKKGTISMSETFRDLPEEHITSEGIFTKTQLMEYLWIAARVPRSKLLTGSQVKNPKYGAFTPLFMYAHKKFNNVHYSKWNWEDARINIALGDALGVCNDFRKAWPYADIRINDTQRKSLARGKRYDEWNSLCTRIVTFDVGEDADVREHKVEIPKELCLLAYQFWIANVTKRDTDTMLLDIYNYGIVPKALDSVVELQEGALEW